jgi:mono/diheme cytochrome c family protein
LSGGRRFATPFGTFVAPNVSMDPAQGIGGWTLEHFASAVLLGVSPEGAHYYPAFPYATYARATPQDVADLWAFWQGLPADATPSQPHDLGFPFSVRRTLGVWKFLNLNADPVIAVGEDPVLQRGAYLVEALAHCAECHTPRDALGGLNTAAWLAGGANPSGEGRIPALPPQGWSAQDIANYLQSGFTPSFDVVGGEMADVVANISRIAPEDRAAIAAYVMAVRSSPSR